MVVKLLLVPVIMVDLIGVVHEHLWLPLSPLISSVPTASGQPEPPEDSGVQRACSGHRSPECQGPLQEGPRILQPAQVREGPRSIRDSGQSRLLVPR